MASRKDQNAEATEKDSTAKPEDTQAPQQPEGQKSSEGQQPTKDHQTPPAQSAERRAVTFLRPFGRYTRGDIAGFDPEEADRLVKKKVAVEGTELPTQTENQDKEPKA